MQRCASACERISVPKFCMWLWPTSRCVSCEKFLMWLASSMVFRLHRVPVVVERVERRAEVQAGGDGLDAAVAEGVLGEGEAPEVRERDEHGREGAHVLGAFVVAVELEVCDVRARPERGSDVRDAGGAEVAVPGDAEVLESGVQTGMGFAENDEGPGLRVAVQRDDREVGAGRE